MAEDSKSAPAISVGRILGLGGMDRGIGKLKNSGGANGISRTALHGIKK